MAKYEYMLHTWGGFYNDEFQKKHGHKPGYFWYETAKARDDYFALLQELEKELDARSLAFILEEGENTRIKTIAKMVFVFNGKEYPHEEYFGYAYHPDSARSMFEEGSYSCDCNRSLFISREYPGFPEMPCGEKIEMKDFQVLCFPGTNKQSEESV